MDTQPLVTVICTCYNKEKWIGHALESILEQVTDFTFDVIVIDDASSDNSVHVIQQISQKYPQRLTTIFHDMNRGITRTWKEACELASGTYIARCDGDDYWTRSDKLQLQMDLLHSTNSLWCCTDFDLVDSSGNLVEPQAFKRGIIPLADTFEKVLATKGFTMPSTWLVRTDILKNASACIAANAIDDTFETQLELFQHTTLAFLPISTAVYRNYSGSDSHPLDHEGIKTRQEGLVRSQLTYLAKYPNADINEILRILIERDAQNDANALISDHAIRTLQHDLEDTREAYSRVVNSKRWRLAAMLDKLRLRF